MILLSSLSFLVLPLNPKINHSRNMSLKIIMHTGIIDWGMVKFDLCCQMRVIADYLVQCVVRLINWIVQFVWFESYINAISWKYFQVTFHPLIFFYFNYIIIVLLFYNIKNINYKLLYCLDILLLMFLLFYLTILEKSRIARYKLAILKFRNCEILYKLYI